MKQYKSLIALMRTFRILGWLTFIGSFFSACGVFFSPMFFLDSSIMSDIFFVGGGMISVVFLIQGIIISAFLFAFAGMIELMMDLSHNTFETKELMKKALSSSRRQNKSSVATTSSSE